MATAVGPAFAAAHRMGHWVLGLAPDVGPSAHVTHSAGFSDANVLVVRIAQPAYGRPAFLAKHSHLSTRQDNSNPITLFCSNSGDAARAPNQLSTMPRDHFYVVNFQPGRDRTHRHRVADLRLTDLAALDAVTGLQAERRENIPFLAVRVVQQGDEAIPVGVVFDRGNSCRDTVFSPLEIDKAVDASCPAASEATWGNTMMVSAAVLFDPLAQRFLGPGRRQFGVVIYRAVPAPCACRIVNSNTHKLLSPSLAWSIFRTNQYETPA